MNLIWQSRKFNPDQIVATYARGYSNGEIKFFDVNRKNQTLREYWMMRSDVRPDVAEQVDVNDRAFGQVKLKEKMPY